MIGCGRLGLGTVQWGTTYGIAGRGRPTAASVSAMLERARDHRIDLLDTAPAYGGAEAIVGALSQHSVGDIRIVTKTRAVRATRISEADVIATTAAFSASLDRLRVDRVYGLLVHHAADLLCDGGDRLWAAMEQLRESGKTGKIGVSVYHPEQLEAILAKYPVDLVQLPLNIYDQRFATSGLLATLRRGKVEVHARSAFLQGLLLMGADQLPEYFAPLRSHHASFHSKVQALGVSPLAACLRFCLGHDAVDRVIVGCDSVDQLEEIIAAVESGAPDAGRAIDVEGLDDLRFLDPSRWPKPVPVTSGC